MKINLGVLTNQPVKFTSEETAETLHWDNAENPILKPVSVELEFFKDGQKVMARGKADTQIELLCSRCAENFGQDIHSEINLEYLEGSGKETAAELELTEEMVRQVHLSSLILDPAEEIRESLVLAIPMKPLCKKDCLGLCPKCRKNKNLGKCSCK